MPVFPEPTLKERVTVSMQRLSFRAVATIVGIMGLLLLIYVVARVRSHNTERGGEERPMGRPGDISKKQAGQRPPRKPVQTADLRGHYEAPVKGEKRARMCMVSRSPRAASFGVVTESVDGGPCAGTGEAVRTANELRLTMAGEGKCTIQAHMTGTKVTFPRSVPKGCDYYCAPGASLAGEVFEKTGGRAADAERTPDLVGDPLCG